MIWLYLSNNTHRRFDRWIEDARPPCVARGWLCFSIRLPSSRPRMKMPDIPRLRPGCAKFRVPCGGLSVTPGLSVTCLPLLCSAFISCYPRIRIFQITVIMFRMKSPFGTNLCSDLRSLTPCLMQEAAPIFSARLGVVVCAFDWIRWFVGDSWCRWCSMPLDRQGSSSWR